jgi:hypothetical protein
MYWTTYEVADISKEITRPALMVMGWYLGGRATREDKMMETPNMKTYAEIAKIAVTATHNLR